MSELNPEQAAAVAARGEVFVSAGAGTGKTTVLVERFARAVLERELTPERILAITYTDRAAAELAARIRARLVVAGRPELARSLDRAWISTIHGFCQRLLRRHAIAAGLDPAFTVLEQPVADALRREAWTGALAELEARRGEDFLDLVTAYGEERLREMMDRAHEALRTSGDPLGLPEPAPLDLGAAVERARSAARELVAVVEAGPAGRWGADNADRAAQLLALLDRRPAPIELTALDALHDRGQEDRAAPYREAVAALEWAAREAVWAAVRPTLDDLLTVYARRYAARKADRSGLDFDDLQLETLALLERRADVRAAVRDGFSEIMVDEFQDTNRLQCALVDLVSAPHVDRFFVGDEHQSIYRFRHADVDVFRSRRRDVAARERTGDPAAKSLTLQRNYRSRPEVLAAVNHLFRRGFGAGYTPLVATGEHPDAPTEPVVEVLATDADTARRAGLEPRESEAAHLAARLAELVAEGACTPGEIVLLFAAGTDADVYERALERAGLDTVSATGRRYFAGQQVGDVVAYLRLLRNRYDDFALLGVLASPFVGVSNDALVHVRTAAGRRPLFRAFEGGTLPAALAADDARLLAAFLQRFERLVGLASRLSLAAAIERVVVEHDYDLALLRRRDGLRRFANLRKLVRLARDFESRHGRSLEGFLAEVAERGVGSGREAEAVVAEEGGDAVRLLTVHAAKGLEFPVVVVADAGRGNGPAGEDVVRGADGAVHLKVPDLDGGRRPTAAHAAAVEAERLADEEERRRVTYVACTRAAGRLIVSGCVSASAVERRSTPVGWLLGLLDVPLDEDGEIVVPGGRIALRLDPGPTPATHAANAQASPEVEGQLAFFGDPSEVAAVELPRALSLPALEPLPAPPAAAPGRLSFSSLALYERCGYRFYAEHLLGLRPSESSAPGALPEVDEAADATVAAAAGLSATELGTAVHDVLEFDAARDPARLERRVRALHPHATAADVERVAELAETWTRLPLAARVAARRDVRPEVRFVTEVAGVTLSGYIDVLAADDGDAHVVDYKTNRLDGRTAADVRDASYGLQEAVYALAALRRGAQTVEVSFAFLDGEGSEASRHWTREDLATLEGRVEAVVRAASDGPYRPRPSPEVCHACPALGLVCAGPDLDRMHGPADA